ncbi:MAG: amidohydrolase family protein [Acidobacteriota bacterium]
MRKKVVIILCLCLMAVVCAAALQVLRAVNPTLVIRAGLLIDGTGDPVQTNVHIFIRGASIQKIRPVSQGGVPLFARRIDARNRTIIPGLIDSHVHFVDEVFCGQFLEFGVTSVRDMGNNTDFILELRDRINAGRRSGPTIFASGYLINNRRIPFGASRYTAVVNTPEEARRAVEVLARRGVDWIKVYFTLPPLLTRTVIQAAKSHGLPVAGHIRRVDARQAVRWGMKTIEHTTGIAEALLNQDEFKDAPPLWTISNRAWLHTDRSRYDDLINLLVQNGVGITANLTLYRSMASTADELKAKHDHPESLMPIFYLDGWVNYLKGRFLELTADRDSWIETEKKVKEFIRLFKDAGGTVLAGTDTPWPYLFPGYSLHEEIHLLVDAGFTPMEALQAATGNAVKIFGEKADIGTVTPGKRADLVILRDNPLADIHNTLSIVRVIKNGRPVPRKNK